MNKAKIEIKRPLSHHIIIAGYLLAPVLYYVIVIPFITYLSLGKYFIHPNVFSQYFDKFGYFGGILILLYPVVAIFLYYISRISWYVFLVHSCLVIANNIYRIPHYEHKQYHLIMAILTVVFTATILFIIQKDFRSPYLHIIRRSFRLSKRIPIDHTILINNKQYELSDLSANGCFVSGEKTDLAIGQKVTIKFHSERLEFSCSGEVSRYSEVDGAGIHFTDITPKVRKAINNYLIDRYSDRYYTDIDAEWQQPGFSKKCIIKNISLHGCFAETDTASLAEGTKGTLQVTFMGKTFSLKGKIVWIKSQTGIAVKFNRSQKDIIELLKNTEV